MSDEIPKKKLNENNALDKDLSKFERLPLKLDKILVDSNEGGGCALAVVSADNKQIGLSLNAIEGTMISFVHTMCARQPHIKTIYHLFLDTFKDMGAKLESAVIEAVEGDIIYGRLCWVDRKKRKFYNKCTAGDTIILAELAKAKLEIVRMALDKLDPLDFEYQEDIYEE